MRQKLWANTSISQAKNINWNQLMVLCQYQQSSITLMSCFICFPHIKVEVSLQSKRKIGTTWLNALRCRGRNRPKKRNKVLRQREDCKALNKVWGQSSTLVKVFIPQLPYQVAGLVMVQVHRTLEAPQYMHPIHVGEWKKCVQSNAHWTTYKRTSSAERALAYTSINYWLCPFIHLFNWLYILYSIWESLTDSMCCKHRFWNAFTNITCHIRCCKPRSHLPNLPI